MPPSYQHLEKLELKKPIDYSDGTWQIAPFDECPNRAEIDRAARRCGLGDNGLPIVEKINEVVRDQGPISGRQLVDEIKARETHELGQGNANWTLFFKYLCAHHPVHRLKRGVLKSGAKRDTRRVAYVARDNIQAVKLRS